MRGLGGSVEDSEDIASCLLGLWLAGCGFVE